MLLHTRGETTVELLTTKELESLLKVTSVTIWRWRNQGMPFEKINNSIRFDRNKVLHWLDNKEGNISKTSQVVWELVNKEKHYLKVVEKETGDETLYEFDDFNDFCKRTIEITKDIGPNYDIYFSRDSMMAGREE